MESIDKPIIGRPKKEFNWDEFKKLCQLQCTKSEIAGWFEISEDTVEKRIREKHDCTFTVIHKSYSEGSKCSLRRYQWGKAVSGNATMLIWLGKQYLGQSDKTDIKHEGEQQKLYVDFSGKNIPEQ